MPRCPLNRGRGSGCWGGQIQWKCGTGCELDDTHATAGFASKFCEECRERVVVSASRVRALTDDLAPRFCNRRSHGIWNSDAANVAQGRYRVLNNTRGCTPPALVLFESCEPPSSPTLRDVPSKWLSDQGSVLFTVSRGTLVPLANPDTRHLPEKVAPTLSYVLVPSVAMRLAMPLAEEVSEKEEELSDEDEEDEQAPPAPEVAWDNHPNLAPLEELSLLEELKPLEQLSTAYQNDRKYHRMMRNRAAAASSRERKSRYIRKLETQVDELTRVVHKLREENCLLYFLDLKPEECAAF